MEIAPTKKPALRQTLPIKLDIGEAMKIPASMETVGGAVESHSCGASQLPARTPSMIKIGIDDPKITLPNRIRRKFLFNIQLIDAFVGLRVDCSAAQ